MKIKRNNLKRLIENFINEEGTEPKGKRPVLPSEELEQTETGDTFVAAQTKKHGSKKDKRRLSRGPDADIQAVTDFRKGSNRGQFPPLTFGPGVDDEGNLKDGKFTTVYDYYDPDPSDQAAVRRYKKQHYLGPTDKSVDDPEITRIGFDEDEDTEESPYGTQYSMDSTQTQYRFDDKTAEDDGYTAHSDDDIYLGPEDEEGYEASEEYSEEDTLYDVKDKDSKDTGIISKIKNFFLSKG